jgi:hypothetical protein
MKTLLFAIGFGVVIANVVAIAVGTRQGIGGMLAIDALSMIVVCLLGLIWAARRMAGPAKRSANALSSRANDAIVGVAAGGLKAKRKADRAIQGFADRVRDRADERPK